VFTPGGGPIGVRFQTGGLIYGSRDIPIAVPGTGGLITEDLSTDNWLLNVGIGPQVMARSGSVRPYAYALAGFGYFATETSFGNGYDYYGDYSTTNYDDWTFAWSAGAGLLIPVSRSLAIDLSVQYVGNGTVRYLAEGDLQPSAGGAPPLIFPRQTEANLLTITVGVSFRY
jgi:opacity protein-like surface antigen